MPATFELFDPSGEVVVRDGGNLPHWYQPGVTYFVTFRTEDSMPTSVAWEWYRRRDDWLRRHGVEPNQGDGKAGWERLSSAAQREFHQTFSRQYLEYLDRGLGECVLRSPQFANIVADALRHFDGERYRLGDFVVMPNHVHVLVCLSVEAEIEALCRSWKRYTATRINRQLGRQGRFWQEESFDHLVRSPEQFGSIRRYIARNPSQARLRQGEFLYERRT